MANEEPMWVSRPPWLAFESVADACRYGLKISASLNDGQFNSYLYGIYGCRQIGVVVLRTTSGTAHGVILFWNQLKLISKFPFDDVEVVALSIIISVDRECFHQVVRSLWPDRPVLAVLTPEYVYYLLNNVTYWPCCCGVPPCRPGWNRLI